ncbi:hypothetical protein Tco_1030439 [Tanacetum coccineum]|uniref:Uncharacterized protein n=1 Tax=Tanacetum coccineum TaxID=301880 RepID=A0ABQ5G7T6_9ASTR
MIIRGSNQNLCLERPNSLPHVSIYPCRLDIVIVPKQGKAHYLKMERMRDYTENLIDLQLLRQDQVSPSKTTERFNNETIKIPGLSNQLLNGAFIFGMVHGQFSEELGRRSPKTWKECLELAREFIKGKKLNAKWRSGDQKNKL